MEPLFLCIECGAAFPGEAGKPAQSRAGSAGFEACPEPSRRGRCPNCNVALIDMQMAQTDERLAVLLGVAEAKRLQRHESQGIVVGALCGTLLGFLLMSLVPALAAMLFAVPLLMALIGALGGKVILPLVVARFTRATARPLEVPGARTRKNILIMVSSIAAIAALPLWLLATRVATDASPAKVIIWNDGDPSWSHLTTVFIPAIEEQIQRLATCAPADCEHGCEPMAVVTSVGAQGLVESAEVHPAGEPADCVRAIAKNWRLPAAPNDASYLMQLPFVFSPKDGAMTVAHPVLVQMHLRQP